MVRDIFIWPDPVLKTRAEPVKLFNGELEVLFKDMIDTMYAADGVGLAAPQVGVGLRLFVVDPEPNNPETRARFYINPEIIQAEGETLSEEGCLSVPGELVEVPRHTWVKLRALDTSGQPFEVETDGLLAIALQHELDHLDGSLIVDRLSTIKRNMLRKKMLSIKSEGGE